MGDEEAVVTMPATDKAMAMTIAEAITRLGIGEMDEAWQREVARLIADGFRARDEAIWLRERNGARLTASKLALALKCLHWLRPGIGPGNHANRGAADRGTEEHGYIEHTMLTGNTEPQSATHARWIDDWYRDRGQGPWLVEVGLAMNPDGVVIAGPGGNGDPQGDRYAWAPHDFLPGTPDAIQLIVDGEPVTEAELEARRATADTIVVRVLDWKSGFRARDHLTAARRNFQMAYLAAMAAQRWGADGAILEIIFVRPDGVWRDVHPTSGYVDAFDLAALRKKVGVLHRHVLDTEDEEALAPKRGPWCSDMFCPQFGRCPVTQGLLAKVDHNVAQLKIPLVTHDVMGPDHAREVYHVLRAAKARMAEVWSALRGWTDEMGPIPVRPGIAWGRRVTTQEKIDLSKPGAVDLLKTELGPHWELAVNMTASKSTTKKDGRSIRTAARVVAAERSKASGRRVTITSVEETVLERLRRIEALAPKVGSKIDEFAITDSDLQNYPYLSAPPDGFKVVERIEEEGDDEAEADDDFGEQHKIPDQE